MTHEAQIEVVTHSTTLVLPFRQGLSFWASSKTVSNFQGFLIQQGFLYQNLPQDEIYTTVGFGGGRAELRALETACPVNKFLFAKSVKIEFWFDLKYFAFGSQKVRQKI